MYTYLFFGGFGGGGVGVREGEEIMQNREHKFLVVLAIAC